MPPAELPTAFADRYRHLRAPRRRFGDRPRNPLGGQAEAEAQRLSRRRIRAQTFVLALMLAEPAAVLACGIVTALLVPGVAGVDAGVASAVWAGALAMLAGNRLTGGYRAWRMRELWLTLTHALVGTVLALLAAAMVRQLAGAPPAATADWLVWWAPAALAASAALRLVVRARMKALIRRGILDHRLVVVGGGEALAPVLHALDQARREGYRVCGFFDERNDERSPSMVAGHHKAGDLDSLVAFVRIAQIDTVILAMPDLSQRRLMEMMAWLSAVPVEIRALPAPGLALPVRARRSRIGSVDLVEVCRPPIDGLGAIQKRAFDLVTATVALVLLAPVMLAVAIAVRLDSPGPILFRQVRHGFNARPIRVLKFRSMYADRCDPTAVRAVRQEDDRVTRVGRFIRRTSLDELPQLFNVLSGQLSMVGPRPHATAARTGDIFYDEVTAAYSARHRVKPGITGWAQVNGWRGELNTAEKIEARVAHDLHYIENWSLWFDLKILAMTPLALLRPRNAY